jgi:hypothetical protein
MISVADLPVHERSPKKDVKGKGKAIEIASSDTKQRPRARPSATKGASKDLAK